MRLRSRPLLMDEQGLCFEAVVAAVEADGLLVVLVQPAASSRRASPAT
jgi:hypothetical protein